jgi:hypothetical protein
MQFTDHPRAPAAEGPAHHDPPGLGNDQVIVLAAAGLSRIRRTAGAAVQAAPGVQVLTSVAAQSVRLTAFGVQDTVRVLADLPGSQAREQVHENGGNGVPVPGIGA